MLHVRTRKWPRALVRKEKKSVAKGQEKKKARKEKEAKGLRKKKNKKNKMLMYAKGIRWKKNDEKHKVLEKRVICSMLDWIDFIVLHAYVVITCSCHCSLTTFHHSSCIISLPSNAQSPLYLKI